PTGDTINGQLPFVIKSIPNIKVPVYGDNQQANESSYIKQGDTVLLAKGVHFPKVNLSEFSSEIKATIPGEGELKLGTATLSSEGVKLTFDGDVKFFNGTANDVTFNFEAEAMADMSDVDFGETIKSEIFGTEYAFEKPEL